VTLDAQSRYCQCVDLDKPLGTRRLFRFAHGTTFAGFWIAEFQILLQRVSERTGIGTDLNLTDRRHCHHSGESQLLGDGVRTAKHACQCSLEMCNLEDNAS